LEIGKKEEQENGGKHGESFIIYTPPPVALQPFAFGLDFLHNLYSSPNSRAIQSRTARWTGHVAHVGKLRKKRIKCLVEKLEGAWEKA
jgi:hypothetical protein